MAENIVSMILTHSLNPDLIVINSYPSPPRALDLQASIALPVANTFSMECNFGLID